MLYEITSWKTNTYHGILNVTPDSFSDGGLYLDSHTAVERALQMAREGADVIDIGGKSTRPGSESISVAEELKRVIPVIETLHKKIPHVPLSIDTYRSEVAEKALQSGTSLVNSLGGFLFDPLLADVIAQYKCSIIIYHIKGKPKTMQRVKIVYKNVIKEITRFFEEQIAHGISHGIRRKQFLVDPGIGFGKTVSQNVEIIRRFSEFKSLNLPLVIGVSRKSHLGVLLKESLWLSDSPPPSERLEASLAETAIAMQNGAVIVRTHDVLETKRFISILDTFVYET